MHTKKKVLIVATEPALTNDLTQQLRTSGFWVECAASGQTGVKTAASLLPEIVVVGDSLPDIAPAELTWKIRSSLPPNSVPLFVMDLAGALPPTSPLVHDSSAVAERNIGTLVNRIHSLFGQSEQIENETAEVESQTIECHGLRLDKGRHRVWLSGKLLQLTPTEFKLLWELARRPGYVLSREELSKSCKGSGSTVQARTIDAHIKAIRRKLDDRANLIETVHGVGYRFRETEYFPSNH